MQVIAIGAAPAIVRTVASGWTSRENHASPKHGKLTTAHNQSIGLRALRTRRRPAAVLADPVTLSQNAVTGLVASAMAKHNVIGRPIARRYLRRRVEPCDQRRHSGPRRFRLGRHFERHPVSRTEPLPAPWGGGNLKPAAVVASPKFAENIPSPPAVRGSVAEAIPTPYPPNLMVASGRYAVASLFAP